MKYPNSDKLQNKPILTNQENYSFFAQVLNPKGA